MKLVVKIIGGIVLFFGIVTLGLWIRHYYKYNAIGWIDTFSKDTDRIYDQIILYDYVLLDASEADSIAKKIEIFVFPANKRPITFFGRTYVVIDENPKNRHLLIYNPEVEKNHKFFFLENDYPIEEYRSSRDWHPYFDWETRKKFGFGLTDDALPDTLTFYMWHLDLVIANRFPVKDKLIPSLIEKTYKFVKQKTVYPLTGREKVREKIYVNLKEQHSEVPIIVEEE